MNPSVEYRHLKRKARDAWIGGTDAWAAMSTGERATVALVCNRFDWLQSMGYSMAEAIDRAGPEWLQCARYIERELSNENGHPNPD